MNNFQFDQKQFIEQKSNYWKNLIEICFNFDLHSKAVHDNKNYNQPSTVSPLVFIRSQIFIPEYN